MASPEPRRLPHPALLTFVAYLFAGGAVLWLSQPSSLASLIYPAAGVSLGAMLVWGPRVAAAPIFVASLLLRLPMTDTDAMARPTVWLAAVAIALAAVGQAMLGAWLVRRRVGAEATYHTLHEAWWFCLLGGVVACLVKGLVTPTALWAAGQLPDGSWAGAAFNSWVSDAAGAVLGGALWLALFASPPLAWSSRRSTIVPPLLTAAVLLVVASTIIERGETRRARETFARDMDQAATSLQARLQVPVYALRALQGLFVASDSVTDREFRTATAGWVSEGSPLAAVGFAPALPTVQVPRLVQRARAAGLTTFNVYDRQDMPAGLTRHDAELLPIRMIEPSDMNAGALGVNVLSVPGARPAASRALQDGTLAVTGRFLLTQAREQFGVVLYQGVRTSDAPDAATGSNAVQAGEAGRGVLFATLRLGDLANAWKGRLPAYLQWCLRDTAAAPGDDLLAGSTECTAAPAGDDLVESRAVPFADHQWRLDMVADVAAVPGRNRADAMAVSLAGLLSSVVLVVMLLTVTGRAKLIEDAVIRRTTELRNEVTERKRTELALRDSEQRFRNIFDHAHVGVVYADLDGGIREANPFFRELVGLSLTDALQRHNLVSFADERDQAELASTLDQMVREPGTMVLQQRRLSRLGGGLVWVNIGLSLLVDAAGQPKRLVAVIDDITEGLKRLEAERARERAEAANRAKSDFLSRMSHELRTPMNAILGFAQLLQLDQRAPLQSHQQDWLAQVRHAGWHLLHLINDILDLSRIESGEMRLQLRPLNVSELVAACLPLIQHDAERRGITVLQTRSRLPHWVVGDETRVKQILTNLLSNAVKYNRDGGTVRVWSTVGEDAQVQIHVEDTGLGMSESQLASLFQPFNRLGREASNIEGTGIGLVISQRLVQLMGGQLRATSTTSVGSEFTVTLPMASQAALDDETASHPDGQLNYRQRHVLYVEDNDTNAILMQGLFTHRPQISLTIATTGQEGLDQARDILPDLILLDMNLPDIDGLAVLHSLKHDDATASIPVVVVSADATSQSVEQALFYGAVDYVTKPVVDFDSFLSRVDSLLDAADTRFG